MVLVTQLAATSKLLTLAAGLNPADYRLSEIQLLHQLVFPKPASPENDFAGYIVQPATGSMLKAGQLVFGCAGTNFMFGGAMSEYGTASVSTTMPIPTGLTISDAACIPIAGLTAYQSIIPYSKPGSRVFLNGGSGGVGSFGIQMAKIEGRHVTVTCSTANVMHCKSLGPTKSLTTRHRRCCKLLETRLTSTTWLWTMLVTTTFLSGRQMRTQLLRPSLSPWPRATT